MTISSAENIVSRKRCSNTLNRARCEEELEKNKVKTTLRLFDKEEPEDEENSQKDKEFAHLEDILDRLRKLTICLLPSSSSEKEILETFDLLFQIRTTMDLDLKFYEVKEILIK